MGITTHDLLAQARGQLSGLRHSLMVFVTKAGSFAMSASENGIRCHCPAL